MIAALRTQRLWLALAATLVGLALAWTVKAPCWGVDWNGQQYRDMCYTDLRWIYENRHLAHDPAPYIDMRTDAEQPRPEDRYGFLEYPALTGLLIYATALASDSVDAFVLWNVGLLSLFAIGTTVLLHRVVPDRRRVMLWALGPPLYLYAFHNWDLYAVFFLVLAFHQYQRGSAFGTGVALGLGASAKIFPIFAAPAFALCYLRLHERPFQKLVEFGSGFLGMAVAFALPFLLRNPDLFLATYTFHLHRTPNFETLWYVIGHYGREWKVGWMAHIGTPEGYGPLLPLVFLAGALAIAGIGWRRRSEPAALAMGFLVLLLVSSKVFSVQYALWLLPLFAILPVRASRYGAYVLTDLAAYVAVFIFFDKMHTEPNRYFDYLAWAVLARFAALMWTLSDSLGIRIGPASAAPAADPDTVPAP